MSITLSIPGALRSLKRRMVQRYDALVRRYDFLRRYDDKKVLLRAYELIFGKELDLTNPQTFTEKLFHQMIAVSQYGNPNPHTSFG